MTDERALRQHRKLSRNTGGQAAVGQGRKSSRDPRQNPRIPHAFHTNRPFRTAHPATPWSTHQRANAHEYKQYSTVKRSPYPSASGYGHSEAPESIQTGNRITQPLPLAQRAHPHLIRSPRFHLPPHSGQSGRRRVQRETTALPGEQGSASPQHGCFA